MDFLLKTFSCFICGYVRMQRKKGQFTSSKAISDEVGSDSSVHNATQGSGQDDGLQETSWVLIFVFECISNFFSILWTIKWFYLSPAYWLFHLRWYKCSLNFWCISEEDDSCKLEFNISLSLIHLCVMLSADVHTVESVQGQLRWCGEGQVVQELCVMHVGLSGLTRFVQSAKNILIDFLCSN